MEYKTVTKHPRLGIEILPNCNLSQITEQQTIELKKSLWSHGVVVIRNQELTASELKEFAKRTFRDSTLGNRYKPINPEIPLRLQSSGVSILGNPQGLNQDIVGQFTWQWHHDKDHLPKTEGLDMNSLYVVMLYGIEIPPEGLDGQPHVTQFIDMIEAYNNLSIKERQQLETYSMYHLSPVKPKPGQELPRKLHPIVSTHKVTEKKGLYLGSDTSILVGLENKLEEAQQFWQELFQKIIKVTPVYNHIWHRGDLIFWDNSQVMHTGVAYDNTKYQRIALRVGVVSNP